VCKAISCWLSAMESVAGSQHIEFAAVISLLFECQRANACRDRVSPFGIEVKGIIRVCDIRDSGRKSAVVLFT
jgi:hypothetical protein